MANTTEAVLSDRPITHRPKEHDDSTIPPTEGELQTIINSIKDASSRPTSPPAPSAASDEFDEGAYWDLPSMAPLNPVSAVST